MSQSKPLLILDLDGTLICTTNQDYGGRFEELFHGSYSIIYKRPGVDEFLKFCFEHFDVAVFTAATSSYAKQIVAKLFTEEQQKTLIFIYSSNSCREIHNSFESQYDEDFLTIKDLRKKVFRKKFHGIRYPRDRVLIIDDTPSTYHYNYGCAIPIPEFRCQKGDTILIKLTNYLRILLDEEQRRITGKEAIDGSIPVSWRHIDKRNWWC